MVSGTHTIPISLGILMGIVWEAYHNEVPLLGVPENPIDSRKGFGATHRFWSTHIRSGRVDRGVICFYWCLQLEIFGGIQLERIERVSHPPTPSKSFWIHSFSSSQDISGVYCLHVHLSKMWGSIGTWANISFEFLLWALWLLVSLDLL